MRPNINNHLRENTLTRSPSRLIRPGFDRCSLGWLRGSGRRFFDSRRAHQATLHPIVETRIAGGNEPTCYVVDSVITSSEFVMAVAESDDTSAAVSHIPVQAAIDASARLSVSQDASSELRFHGEITLPFALTCLRVVLRLTDEKIQIEPFEDREVFLRPDLPLKEGSNALLSGRPTLIEWD